MVDESCPKKSVSPPEPMFAKIACLARGTPGVDSENCPEGATCAKMAMRIVNLDFERRAYHVKESYKVKNFTRPKTDEYRWVDLPGFQLD